MSIGSTVNRAKRAAAAIMTDTCRITRTAEVGDAAYVPQVIDEATGQYPEQGRVTVYQGICRMQVKADINSNVVQAIVAEHEFTYLTSQLQVPVTAQTGMIGVDNICEILTCPHDPDLAGREFNVVGSYHKSHSGYRRFRLREPVA